ncbi:MAG: ABC transporter ATP-binding protein [Gemmatimonadetes bacterium]|nr:MAG: ABC transporter ATP-binding protein [Gemmatimonadota bacterium]
MRGGPRDDGRGRVAHGAARCALPAHGRAGGAAVAAVNAELRFEHVSFSYGTVPALRDVSFSLAPGERAALLGRNGAGKSTVLRLVTGLVHPAEGTVSVGDWDTRGRAPESLARRVGSVFQHADQQLFARSLRDDVAFGPRALGLAAAEIARRVDTALAALELTAHAAEHPYDLPPAFRKLAALAGALALEPAVLVLDEPTAGLDRPLRARVARALADSAAAGVVVLVATHDLAFAAEVLERSLVLDRGRVAWDAPLAALLTSSERLAPLGLAPPAGAALSAALDLPGRPVRERDVAHALARVAAARGPV